MVDDTYVPMTPTAAKRLERLTDRTGLEEQQIIDRALSALEAETLSPSPSREDRFVRNRRKAIDMFEDGLEANKHLLREYPINRHAVAVALANYIEGLSPINKLALLSLLSLSPSPAALPPEKQQAPGKAGDRSADTRGSKPEVRPTGT